MSYTIANLEGILYSLPTGELFLDNQNYTTQIIPSLQELPTIEQLKESSNAPRLGKFFDKYFTNLFQEDIDINIYDVGGYIGVFGLNVATFHQRIASSANLKIKIFEPTPLNKFIIDSVAINKLSEVVEVIPVAISNQSTTTGYYARENKLISGRLYKLPGFTKLYDVEVKKLDAYYEQSNSNNELNIIKIDTEGLEVKVLEGGSKMLSVPNTILFLEYWPWLEHKENHFGIPYHEFLLEHFHIIDIKTVGFPHLSQDRHIKNKAQFKRLINDVLERRPRTTDLLCISKAFKLSKHLENLFTEIEYPQKS